MLNDFCVVCVDILVNIGVWVICQDMILSPQNFHSFLGILLQLEQKKELIFFGSMIEQLSVCRVLIILPAQENCSKQKENTTQVFDKSDVLN